MDGILLINKEKGCTSHDVVYKVKKLLNEKVGHTGTLDPLATGVLPLLIGKGTLCSKYLINHDKKYQVVLQLGKKTTTADIEGDVIDEQIVDKSIMSFKNVQNVLNTFVGKQEQIPPMYSAIKVNGKKLYEYARKGQAVEVKPRNIEIFEIKLINVDSTKQQISFEVYCSKGTYIRSLCEDIAKKMDTVGYMKELNRLQVGDFKIEDTITVAELKDTIEDTSKKIESSNDLKNEDPEMKIVSNKKCYISIEKLFENQPKIDMDNKKLQLFLNGVKLTYNLNDGIYSIFNNNSFIGIGVVEKNLLKRDIVC